MTGEHKKKNTNRSDNTNVGRPVFVRFERFVFVSSVQICEICGRISIYFFTVLLLKLPVVSVPRVVFFIILVVILALVLDDIAVVGAGVVDLSLLVPHVP